MPLSAGDKLGSYEILAPIGAGGMGEVWRAKDTKLNLLASVRNDRRSAGKTTAVSAGLIVSTHEGHIVGGNPALEASGVNDVQLQGGYPPYAVRKHASDGDRRAPPNIPSPPPSQDILEIYFTGRAAARGLYRYRRYCYPFNKMIAKFLLVSVAASATFAADPPLKTFPFAYTQEDLPNGLRVVTIPTDFPNLVSVFIVVQTGSRNEVEPGKTGFAHLFEHVMFKGTEKYPPEKYEEILKRSGAASNASTSDDLTVYHATFSKPDLPQILAMEADRFQNLKYTPEVFKTETGAVLGEYNKNSSDPNQKLSEVLRDTAFDRHTYKHTTMGFLKDVQGMPNQYEYSLRFFDRYYRPEYTTIIVTGDVNAKQVRALVNQQWGNWKRGGYHPDIPVEPPQQGPRENHVDWPAPTLPLISIAYKGPAYSDTQKDAVALDVLAMVAFSRTSDIYQKLVIRDQKVDSLNGGMPFKVDPDLFTIRARVKRVEDVPYVREQILETVRRFQNEVVSKDKLEAVKSNERYSFALQLDNSESVAQTVSYFVALKRTPATIDQLYTLYSQLTPEDLREMARKYLVENGRTIVTLTGTGK